MRLDCSGGDTTDDGGAVVVVGVKLDSRSRELLTWALVKVAQTGDSVVAIHVLDYNADKSTLISLVKTFDNVLAAYKGFCNLKQVDLKLKVCRGAPVHKVLSQESKSCGATTFIVGTSKVHHKFRSRISIAKNCAKNLERNVSVICVDNGKVMFRRESTSSILSESKIPDVFEYRILRRKKFPRSPLSIPPFGGDISSSSSGDESNLSMSTMALVPIKTQEMTKSRAGWSLLRSVFLHGRSVSETSPTKESSILQWILNLPSRKSEAAIYPHQKRSINNGDKCHLDLNREKGIIVPYSAGTNSGAYSSSLLYEELIKPLVDKYSTTCQLFSYQELLLATDNFIPENLIGMGGSSMVYRGRLSGGKELAVKLLNPSDDILKHFISEIEIITHLQHKNLISLVGFCFEEDKLLLVYNLLSRGSLEENLHGTHKSGSSFGWEERYKVALGVAEALDHLHNAVKPVIHRDVKSSNILLSDDFEPQLSDFGLATWASSSSHNIDTLDVAGTFGYLAPEYFMHGKLNQEIDVFAFGVVLLELLSGRKPIDNGRPKGQESLLMWATHISKKGKLLELQDPNLVDAYDCSQFENMILAAALCIRNSPQSRPKISIVLKLLQGDPELTDWARQQINTSKDINDSSGEVSSTNIQSLINLALHDLEDDTSSMSSISVEDYLQGRWSRTSSFN